MSTPVRPSTPIAQSTPSTPQTGTWRHPKLDEIERRQNAQNFSERNVVTVVWNLAGIVILFFTSRWLWDRLPYFFDTGKALQPWAGYGYHILQSIFVFNIVIACSPLYRSKDDMSDIPLTPAQRKLLGLPPSSAPPTPGSQYITPPRYARTPTPLSGSPMSKDAYSNSPLAGKGKPSPKGSIGSDLSPVPSAFLQKTMAGSNGGRRTSYGSPSPLGPSVSRGTVGEAPGTPSPSTGKGLNIGLNNKWLYDKGRRNSGSARLYT